MQLTARPNALIDHLPANRYESWTTPEYYQQAEASVALTKQRQQRSADLEQRRERLRAQLATEQQALDDELSERSRPKSRTATVPTDTLRHINDALRRTADEKRRCDLESQLYKDWRHAARADAILHESKSDHEALAKLNWLDRQVAAQVDRAAEQRSDEERQLRLHEESRRHMECLAQRRGQRNVELTELRTLQDAHVAELKLCTTDSERLRAAEAKLRQRLAAVDAERSVIAQKQQQRRRRFEPTGSNIRRIKLLLRQRSDAVCAGVRDDCAQLDRLRVLASVDIAEQMAALRATFERALDDERRAQESVEAMYESEVKHLLIAREREWTEQDAERTGRMQRACDELCQMLRQEVQENVQRQRDMVAIKESHIKAVQRTNERLKELMADLRSDELSGEEDLRALTGALDATTTGRRKDGSGVDFLLPLDNGRRDSRSSAEPEGSIVDSLRSSSIGSELSAPRYGRKKIAWT